MNFPGTRALSHGRDLRGSVALWVGVDDTDSLRGMCTTFLATEFVRELTSRYDLIGYPRLVRLNPNVPWKTRGNGALALRVGHGRGRRTPVGVIRGRPVLAYPESRGTPDPVDVAERLAVLVDKWADVAARGTDPGLVVLTRKPRVGLYWKAVRGIVTKPEAVEALRGIGLWRGWKSGRGIIGAAAACAWRPRDRTWELLAYRDRSRWGTFRDVDPGSVQRMDRTVGSTFNNFDYEGNRLVIAPRTPCPVLLGIRGEDPEDLVRAFHLLRCETPDRWLIFLTNQGTDDHVLPFPSDVPHTAGRYSGRVTEAARTLPGGHTVFRLDEREVTAYEPSKGFRRVVRGLVVGDRLEVVGSVRSEPRTINLEKLRVLELATVWRKVANPMCEHCGVRMKSRGRGAPFRCRRCGRTASRTRTVTERVPRTLTAGWYEPPAGSRRHLSKPISRLVREASAGVRGTAREARSAGGPAPAHEEPERERLTARLGA